MKGRARVRVRVIVRVLFVILNIVYFYFERPVFALGFTDWAVPCLAWGAFLLLIPLVDIFNRFRLFVANTAWGEILRKIMPWAFKIRPNVVDMENYKLYTSSLLRYKVMAVVGGVLLITGIANGIVLPLFTSTPILYSQKYRQLLGEVKESSFTGDVAPVNLSQIRIVDEETAHKLADKKIGEVQALGSEVQVGTMALQSVKGKLYYVAPLEHRGFFQWLSNRNQGSKGYVMVSATNPQDVRLVQQVNGKDVYLKYQMQGFGFDYLPRYVYYRGVVDVGITEFSFELDDDYNPYWVATLYENKIGFRGKEAVGVVVVDGQTGEVKRYDLVSTPAWIDRVQPEAIIFQQASDWGNYINGYWNALFAKTGTLKPTDSYMKLIYGSDGEAYWYTAITSSGRDESTVGFLLVDSRTKEAKWYKIAGANEAGAKKSAEGQVQEKGYRAGEPILYNINSIPTYISPLKDKEGLLKAVAFISVENYNLVGVGNDGESAMRAYQQSLNNRGNLFVPVNENRQFQIRGKVHRVAAVVKNNESYYYLSLQGDNRIYVGPVSISPRLPLVASGDSVVITVSDTRGAVLPMVDFKPDEQPAVPPAAGEKQ